MYHKVQCTAWDVSHVILLASCIPDSSPCAVCRESCGVHCVSCVHIIFLPNPNLLSVILITVSFTTQR